MPIHTLANTFVKKDKKKKVRQSQRVYSVHTALLCKCFVSAFNFCQLMRWFCFIFLIIFRGYAFFFTKKINIFWAYLVLLFVSGMFFCLAICVSFFLLLVVDVWMHSYNLFLWANMTSNVIIIIVLHRLFLLHSQTTLIDFAFIPSLPYCYLLL